MRPAPRGVVAEEHLAVDADIRAYHCECCRVRLGDGFVDRRWVCADCGVGILAALAREALPRPAVPHRARTEGSYSWARCA